jgi:hypothetical protein
MDVRVIDITTYAGICSEAEHYYAKEKSFKYAGEMVWGTDSLSHLTSDDPNADDILYIPTQAEAEMIARKDYPIHNSDNQENVAEIMARRKGDIDDMLEIGTRRFLSIKQIMKRCRELYPKSLIIYTIYGSHKKFLEATMKQGLHEPIDPEYEDLMEPEV